MTPLNKQEEEMQAVIKSVCEKIDPRHVLEIGSGWGISGEAFMRYSRAELFTVDKSEVLLGKRGEREFDQRMEPFKDRFNRIIGDSREAVPGLVDDSFDIAFIDGDHRDVFVFCDLENVVPKMHKGGVILVDDVMHHGNWDNQEWYGVAISLWKFCYSRKLEMIIHPAAHGIAQINL